MHNVASEATADMLLRELTDQHDRMSAGGGCEAAVTAEQDVAGLGWKNVLRYCMRIGIL